MPTLRRGITSFSTLTSRRLINCRKTRENDFFNFFGIRLAPVIMLQFPAEKFVSERNKLERRSLSDRRRESGCKSRRIQVRRIVVVNIVFIDYRQASRASKLYVRIAELGKRNMHLGTRSQLRNDEIRSGFQATRASGRPQALSLSKGESKVSAA